jgi:uncharacterized SAM-binding protein YcdF (DUF218 family)
MGRLLGGLIRIMSTLALLGVCLGLVLMRCAGYWMQVNDTPEQADYIIPLAGDDTRLIKATELYHQGFAPMVLLSNAVEPTPTRLDALRWKMGYPHYERTEYRARLLGLLGVPASVTDSFGKAHISTVEEAEALRTYLRGRQARLLLVTSPTHARRAKMIFEDVLPECRIMVSDTDEGTFGATWWRDQQTAKELILELSKTVHYLLGGVFRSTDAKLAG